MCSTYSFAEAVFDADELLCVELGWTRLSMVVSRGLGGRFLVVFLLVLFPQNQCFIEISFRSADQLFLRRLQLAQSEYLLHLVRLNRLKDVLVGHL